MKNIVFYLKKDTLPNHGCPALVIHTKAYRKVQEEKVALCN